MPNPSCIDTPSLLVLELPWESWEVRRADVTRTHTGHDTGITDPQTTFRLGPRRAGGGQAGRLCASGAESLCALGGRSWWCWWVCGWWAPSPRERRTRVKVIPVGVWGRVRRVAVSFAGRSPRTFRPNRYLLPLNALEHRPREPAPPRSHPTSPSPAPRPPRSWPASGGRRERSVRSRRPGSPTCRRATSPGPTSPVSPGWGSSKEPAQPRSRPTSRSPAPRPRLSWPGCGASWARPVWSRGSASRMCRTVTSPEQTSPVSMPTG